VQDVRFYMLKNFQLGIHRREKKKSNGGTSAARSCTDRKKVSCEARIHKRKRGVTCKIRSNTPKQKPRKQKKKKKKEKKEEGGRAGGGGGGMDRELHWVGRVFWGGERKKAEVARYMISLTIYGEKKP